MYPPNKAAALVTHIEAEDAVRALADAAYREYAPVVLSSLRGVSLTADGDDTDLPIDPADVLATQLFWEALVNEYLGYGVSLVYAWELVRTFEALGATGQILEMTEPQPWPGETTEQATERRAAAEEVVARSMGIKRKDMTAFSRRLDALPTIRQLQLTHLATVSNRMVHTPDTVFREIAKTLDIGLEKGLSIPDQARAIDDTIRAGTSWWAHRAETVARTETAGAMSAATVDAAKTRNTLLGEDLEQLWICTLDGKTRDSHFAADGQRVGLGAKFQVGSAELRYPGDPEGPVHETANCRCRLAVLAADEDSPVEFDRHTERGPGNSTVKNRTGSRQDEIDRRAENGVIRAIEDPNGVGRVASAAPEENNVADDVDTQAETFRTFTDQPLGVLGEHTEDRRLLASDMTVTFRDFPLPLMWVKQTSHSHLDGFTVGVIESGRVEDGKVLCSGYMLNSPEADEAATQIAHGVSKPSLDLNDVEWKMTDADGNEVTYSDMDAAWEKGEELKVFETFTSGKVMGATLVSIQAIANAKLELNADREARDVGIVASLVASAPLANKHDVALFADPKLDGPTPLQYDEATGRVFGHLACFGTCHTGFKDQCVTAPRSKAEYRYFHTSQVQTVDGALAVGRLTVNTGHAGPRLSAAKTIAHYDDTGTCFALVRAGEDEHGIWVSGIANPVATPEVVTAGIQSPLSGDWRKMGGNLELVAALAVNTPGFPIVASGASGDDGLAMSLVASLAPRRERAASKMPSAKEFAAAVLDEMRAQERRNAEAEAIFAAEDTARADEAGAIFRALDTEQILEAM